METMETEETEETEEIIEILKINKMPLEEVQIVDTTDTRTSKYYIYGYFVDDELKYIGRGSDAHVRDKYRRGRDLKGHQHCIPEDLDHSRLKIKILDHAMDEEKIKMIEAAYIKGFNTVEDGWNNREELRDNKFYDILDTITDEKHIPDVKTLVHLLMQNATGAKGTEPVELAQDILSKLDIEDQNVCIISNEQFGGYNILTEIINNDYKQNTLSTICSEEMLMKIGADDLMDKDFLNVNTGIENFLEMDFGNKKFDLIIMNPPWVGDGKPFIEKARSLLKKGGKLICIIGYNQFADLKGRPGSFNYLQQFGAFERIETFKGQSQRDYFANATGNAVGDWCWFIYRNENIKIPTKIINRLGKEFDYLLEGNEMYVPQIPNEKDYFDWREGSQHITKDANSKSEVNGTYVVARKNLENMIIRGVVIGDPLENKGMLFKDIEESVIRDMSIKINLYDLYADSKSGDKLRCPPIRKDQNENQS